MNDCDGDCRNCHRATCPNDPNMEDSYEPEYEAEEPTCYERRMARNDIICDNCRERIFCLTKGYSPE